MSARRSRSRTRRPSKTWRVTNVRNPLSLKKLVYLDGQKAVLYRSRMNPSLDRNFEAMDPLEWLARLADHIPDADKHRTHFYAHYANRVRGERGSERLGHEKHEEEQLIAYITDTVAIRRILAISVSARRRSHLLRSERSSVCRWTTRGERSGPAQPDTQSQP